jgi:predicted ATPase
MARPLWLLGYPDQALQQAHEGLTLAQERAHPFSMAYALNWTATVHQFRREPRATQERTEALLALSTEQGFALWVSFATVLQGWSQADHGQRPAGMAQIRQGIATFQATGARVDRPYFLTLLAEAYGHSGQVEDGLAVLAEALALVRQHGERYWEAECYRLKGELLLALSGDYQAEVETCYRQALAIARRQQAKSLELRATMSLGRLWQHQGKRAEAHDLLAPILAGSPRALTPLTSRRRGRWRH